jgi:hypothetical protein
VVPDRPAKIFFLRFPSRRRNLIWVARMLVVMVDAQALVETCPSEQTPCFEGASNQSLGRLS